jgi:hypothetical protein
MNYTVRNKCMARFRGDGNGPKGAVGPKGEKGDKGVGPFISPGERSMPIVLKY